MTFAFSASGKPWLAAVLAFGNLALVSSAAAQEHGHDLTRLGTVEFTVECTATAQEDFNRAMALYHSFAWSEASQSFTAIAEADPACGIAHWGRAMVMLDNPFLWPGNLPPEKLDAVAEALEEAKSRGLYATEERQQTSGYGLKPSNA